MKKTAIYLGLFSLMFLFSCKKSGVTNPLADVKNLGTGSYITLDSNINLNLAFNAPASTASIKVNQYGADVEKVVLYVVKGANADPTTWKKIKEIPFTGNGTVISATNAEISAAVGIPLDSLTPGTSFTFYNQVITKDGRTFDITNTPGALESNGNYKSVLRWQAFVTCPFVGPVGGAYTVITDGWADWNPGDIVQVSDGPGANQVNLSLIWPNPNFAGATNTNKFIIDVDPATGSASMALAVVGHYASSGGYDLSVNGGNGNDNAGYIFSCVGTITLNLHLFATGFGDQGNNKLILQKN